MAVLVLQEPAREASSQTFIKSCCLGIKFDIPSHARTPMGFMELKRFSSVQLFLGKHSVGKIVAQPAAFKFSAGRVGMLISRFQFQGILKIPISVKVPNSSK